MKFAEDPLFWAKHPKSEIAVDMLFSAIERTKDRRLIEILAHHKDTQAVDCRSPQATKYLCHRLGIKS